MRATAFKQQNCSLQLHSVLESIAHLLAQHIVNPIDGIKSNRSQLGHVHLAVSHEHTLIYADVYALTH